MRFAVVLSLCPGVALGFGPPYSTDDPEPVPYRHTEVILASALTHSRGDVSRTFPNLDINYGLAPDTQLSFTFPFILDQPSGGRSQWAYSDTFVSLKRRFIHETKFLPEVAVFPQVVLPTGDASRGFGNGQAQYFFPIWFQKSSGNWSSYWGGGYWVNPGPGNRDYWFFGWQAQTSVAKNLAIGGEIFYRTSSAVGEPNATGFNIGAVYDCDEGHHLLFSVGSDIHGPNFSTLYLGYQWTFGPKSR